MNLERAVSEERIQNQYKAMDFEKQLRASGG